MSANAKIGGKSLTIENVEFYSTELLFCDATDLLADMSAVIAPAGGAWNTAVANRGDAIAMFAREVSNGRLTSFLARVLSGTTMMVRGAGAGTFDLGSRDGLNNAFTGRQKFAFPAVKLALEVSFKGFLDGLALIGLKIPTQSTSGDSNPSTSATG